MLHSTWACAGGATVLLSARLHEARTRATMVATSAAARVRGGAAAPGGCTSSSILLSSEASGWGSTLCGCRCMYAAVGRGVGDAGSRTAACQWQRSPRGAEHGAAGRVPGTVSVEADWLWRQPRVLVRSKHLGSLDGGAQIDRRRNAVLCPSLSGGGLYQT